MSTTLSSASLKPRKNKTNKVTEFIMTAFAVIFTLAPVAVMVMLGVQFVDFSGAGDLVQTVSSGLFGEKER